MSAAATRSRVAPLPGRALSAAKSPYCGRSHCLSLRGGYGRSYPGTPPTRAAPGPNAVKAATRCGMGPCQGRQCGYSVQAILAEVHNLPVGDVSFFNIRPPLKPVTLGEIASLGDMRAGPQ